MSASFAGAWAAWVLCLVAPWRTRARRAPRRRRPAAAGRRWRLIVALVALAVAATAGPALGAAVVATAWVGRRWSAARVRRRATRAAAACVPDLGELLRIGIAAGLTPVRGSITVRDLELAFGTAEPRPGESVPTQEGAAPAVAAAQAQVAGLAESMARGLELVQQIAKALDARLGAANSPDLSPLRKLLECVDAAGRSARGEAPAGEGASGAYPGGEAVLKPTGAIQSREDAIRMLQRVSEWIERNEPSNPAPLLIQRAQRLMKKNFMEIIRDLVPEGLGQIEKLAGPGRE